MGVLQGLKASCEFGCPPVGCPLPSVSAAAVSCSRSYGIRICDALRCKVRIRIVLMSCETRPELAPRSCLPGCYCCWSPHEGDVERLLGCVGAELINHVERVGVNDAEERPSVGHARTRVDHVGVPTNGRQVAEVVERVHVIIIVRVVIVQIPVVGRNDGDLLPGPRDR